MLTAYIDDSGSDGQENYFILAGYVSTPARWVQFSDDWSAALASGPRPLQYLKAAQAQALRREFAEWSPEERDIKLRECAAIVNAQPCTAAAHTRAPWSGLGPRAAR